MSLDRLDQHVIWMLRINPGRHVYAGRDGMYYISIAPDDTTTLSKAAVDDMVKRGILVLDFPGFFKLHQQHRTA